MNAFLLVAVGGALGACSRYSVGLLAGKFVGTGFPYATLAINIAGSFLMGLVIGWLARYLPENSNDIRLFVGVGLLGGFTTFSSFSLDAITLFERGQLMALGLYVAGSVLISMLALLLGLSLMRGMA